MAGNERVFTDLVAHAEELEHLVGELVERAGELVQSLETLESRHNQKTIGGPAGELPKAARGLAEARDMGKLKDHTVDAVKQASDLEYKVLTLDRVKQTVEDTANTDRTGNLAVK